MTTYHPRALVAEDDASWQQILAEILTDEGLTVDVAGNLEMAVAFLRAEPHRLAVVDLSLGKEDHRNQDGLRILDAVRRHDPGCVAILLTGYATVEIAVSALTEHGAATCLRKETFRRSEFRSVVRQALTGAPGAAAVATQLEANKPGRSDIDAVAVESRAPESAGRYPQSAEAASHDLSALVVEDDAGWRAILAELLGEAGFRVQVCRSYGEALGRLRRDSFSLAIVDLSLASSLAPDDNTDGLRLLVSTKKAGIPSIVVSGSAPPEDVERAYEEHGIVAFLEKRRFDRQAFRDAVAAAVQASGRQAGELGDLTAREQEVLQLLVQGLTNKEIADALVISDNTVKRHLKAIFTKLQVNTRSAAVAKAISAGGR